MIYNKLYNVLYLDSILLININVEVNFSTLFEDILFARRNL